MKATYIHGPGIDEPLMMNREGNNYFYHTDGLGSVVGLSNDLGEIEQQYLYTSFGGMTVFNKEGSEIQSVDGIKNPYGYTGREMDTESNLYYYRARYYSPDSGRFLTPDPIGFRGGDTNLYRYVYNRPTVLTDPTGNNPFLIAVGFGGLVGGGIGFVGALATGSDLKTAAESGLVGAIGGAASVIGAGGAILTGVTSGAAVGISLITGVAGSAFTAAGILSEPQQPVNLNRSINEINKQKNEQKSCP